MVGLSTWLRYFVSKVEYSVYLTRRNYLGGRIAESEIPGTILRNVKHGRITFMHRYKGEEMDRMIGGYDGTLLVRCIPEANPDQVYVGDVVVLKNPINQRNFIVRRLAAVEGYEMASTDEKEEPFILENDQCWVLADNQDPNIKPETYDSRTFGPVTMRDIVGRAIYCLRNSADHGPVDNSDFSKIDDAPILEVELNVDVLSKYNKGCFH